MAGPKITRLGDPANPYGRKGTPTSAPTPAQQAANRARSQAGPERTQAKPAPKPAQPVGGLRQRQIDLAVDRRVMGNPAKRR